MEWLANLSDVSRPAKRLRPQQRTKADVDNTIIAIMYIMLIVHFRQMP
jgi:hypothetical protein